MNKARHKGLEHNAYDPGEQGRRVGREAGAAPGEFRVIGLLAGIARGALF
jgi:hypothetical protein